MSDKREEWIQFIDENLAENLTTGFLAEQFNLSESQLKRMFQKYFKMTVSDYVRKRRMITIAEGIRSGKHYRRIAAKYGYNSHAGLMRPFVKEFFVTPAEYSKGVFDTIGIESITKSCSKIQVSIFDIASIKLEARASLHAEDYMNKEAVYSFWKKHGFPVSPVFRLDCNKEVREDKVAFWYQDAASKTFDYMLGSVVKNFKEEPDESLFQVKINAGKYAIFQTDSISDEENFIEVLEIFHRVIWKKWMRENQEQIDPVGMVFERYVNRKVYLYVPLKK